MEKPSYYAIIPASVRYDKELRPNEKLLYGEITALCGVNGYCWGTNQYFADLYGVSDRMVREWISHLKERGYIDIKMIYKEGTKEVLERRIYIVPIISTVDEDPPEENFPTSGKKVPETPGKKFPTPEEKKFRENNTRVNNTSMNNIIGTAPEKKQKKFVKPTVEEIKTYCAERNNQLDAEYFYDHYEANGWKIGKAPMKDWKATIRNWERNGYSGSGKKTATCGDNKTQEFMDFEPF